MPAKKTKKTATKAETAAKKAPKVKSAAPANKMSALDAAAKVLGETGGSMTTK